MEVTSGSLWFEAANVGLEGVGLFGASRRAIRRIEIENDLLRKPFVSLSSRKKKAASMVTKVHAVLSHLIAQTNNCNLDSQASYCLSKLQLQCEVFRAFICRTTDAPSFILCSRAQFINYITAYHIQYSVLWWSQRIGSRICYIRLYTELWLRGINMIGKIFCWSVTPFQSIFVMRVGTRQDVMYDTHRLSK